MGLIARYGNGRQLKFVKLSEALVRKHLRYPGLDGNKETNDKLSPQTPPIELISNETLNVVSKSGPSTTKKVSSAREP